MGNKVSLEGEEAAALAFGLGYGTAKIVDCAKTASVFEAFSMLAGVQVKDKAPTYVGGRMGRPEKAKRREMKPLVHVLFPVSLAGGTHRDLWKRQSKITFLLKWLNANAPNARPTLEK